MRRWAFRAITLMCLGLLAVLCWYWHKSRLHSHEIEARYWRPAGTRPIASWASVTVDGGIVTFGYFRVDDIPDPVGRSELRMVFPPGLHFHSKERGPKGLFGTGPAPTLFPGLSSFTVTTDTQNDKVATATWYEAAAPAWCVAVILLLLPVSWLLNAMHRRRARRLARLRRVCFECGYDLRASPD